ncbi:MAG: hypothetical protein ACHQ2Y_10595, partial [Candidatus Lutacidiplasmatales archaeon]
MSGLANFRAIRIALLAPEVRLRVRNSLPLVFLGGGALMAATLLLQGGSGAHAGRFPFWLLSLSIGVVAFIGGGVSLVAGDFDTVGPSPPLDESPFPAEESLPPTEPEEEVAELPRTIASEDIIVSRRAWERLNEMAAARRLAESIRPAAGTYAPPSFETTREAIESSPWSEADLPALLSLLSASDVATDL